MKKTNLTISYDEEKLSTIMLYMEQKETSLETELCRAVDALYTKHVPVNVREFLDLKSGIAKSAVQKPKPKLVPAATAAETTKGDKG